MNYRIRSYSRDSSSPITRLTRNNSLIIGSLTLLSVALTAYLLTTIVNTIDTTVISQFNSSSILKNQTKEFQEHEFGFSETSISRGDPNTQHYRPISRINHKRSLGPDKIGQKQQITSLNLLIEDHLNLGKGENETATRIFSQKTKGMSKTDLIKLMKILEGKSDAKHAESRENTARGGIGRLTTTETDVVHRSDKLTKLMNYLDSIELATPEIYLNDVEKASVLAGDIPLIKSSKPDMVNSFINDKEKNQISLIMPRNTRGIQYSQDTIIHGVGPTTIEAGWPQQDTPEDWPSQEVEPSIAPKKKKKKRKKMIVTTSTTTTTTTSTTTPSPPTTTTFSVPTSPATPALAFEEVWIEEEEDIVRAPKRKLKKYKKKTSPPPSTTTQAPTTTTTTYTTPIPTTTTTSTTAPVSVEDWPEEQWPETTTKISKLIPQKHEEQWPEDEWLNLLKTDIQNRIQ